MSQRPINKYTLVKVLATLATSSIFALLSSCGNTPSGTITVLKTGGFQPHHGPFDGNGNYIDDWADKPPKRRYVTRDQLANLKKKSKKTKSRPQVAPVSPTAQPRFVSHTPSSATTIVSSTPKAAPRPAASTRPKPKSVAVKPKAKPPITHHVKRGDTLYGLSRKYGTSVGAIQRANKLKGTNIGLGARLIIPRN